MAKDIEMEDKGLFIQDLQRLVERLKQLDEFENSIEKDYNIIINAIYHGNNNPGIEFIYNDHYYTFKNNKIKRVRRFIWIIRGSIKKWENKVEKKKEHF